MKMWEKKFDICKKLWEGATNPFERDKIRNESDLRCHLFHKAMELNEFKKDKWKLNTECPIRLPPLASPSLHPGHIDLVFRNKHGAFAAWELKVEYGSGASFQRTSQDILKLQYFLEENSDITRPDFRPLAILGLVGVEEKIKDAEEKVRGKEIKIFSKTVPKVF